MKATSEKITTLTINLGSTFNSGFNSPLDEALCKAFDKIDAGISHQYDQHNCIIVATDKAESWNAIVGAIQKTINLPS